jgi:hypothetical protein
LAALSEAATVSLDQLVRMHRTLPHVLVLLGLACEDGGSGTTRPGAASPAAEVSADGVAEDTAEILERAPTSPARYYVSPAGSDSAPGTEREPWRTLRRALTRLHPGDSLLVRGGTYEENVRNPRIRQGLPDARITVAAYPGERPVLVGLLSLTRPSYWTLDGINVTWADGNPSTTHMVKMTDGVGWVFQNAELWGARSYAALLVYGSTEGEPAGWALRGNCVHDTYASNDGSQDQNLYINTGVSAGPGLVERNVIFNAPNGMNVKLGYGRGTPQPGDGTARVTVRFNTMYGALKNLMVTDESHDNVIEHNIIVASASGWAIRVYRLAGLNNVVRDNVFHGQRGLQYADPGYGSLVDGGGNRLAHDPRFDAAGCEGFRPGNPDAQAYGRYAR